MKKWQQILEQHHNVEIVSDTQVKVLGIIYHPETKILRDDMVTCTGNGYTDSDGHSYKSIYEYLGY
jgi:hypothetical protein